MFCSSSHNSLATHEKIINVMSLACNGGLADVSLLIMEKSGKKYVLVFVSYSQLYFPTLITFRQFFAVGSNLH